MVAKACTKCPTLDVPGAFYRVKRTGAIRGQCRDCDKARMAEWQRNNREKRDATYKAWKAANPEEYQRQQRASKARRRADPERLAMMRDQAREHWRRKHNVPPERFKIGREGCEAMVPVVPIRDAVEWAGIGWTEIGERMGVDESVVRRALQQDKMNAAKAGKILEAIGVLPADIGL